MSRKIILTKEQRDFIEEHYPKLDLTLSEMVEYLGVSVETIRRGAKEWGLERPKFKIYGESLEWLKLNYNKPYKELEEKLKVDKETIRVTLKNLEITRTTKYRPFKLDMNDEEFLSDLKNPKLTAPDIVDKYCEKYGIGVSRIHQLRKEQGIKLQIDTLNRESSSEKLVREILDKLDLAYIKEKRVGKYYIDFYLGFKMCIEVQGHYWHNKPTRKLTDKRKKAYLEEEGYKVLYIWDNEMDKAENAIIEFIKKQGLPIS